MSGQKVPRPSAAGEVLGLLDSPEVEDLVAELDALRWTGRKGYGARALVGACLVKSLYAIPTWTRTARLIAEHDGLREALGGAPSEWACYRFATKLRDNKPLLDARLSRVVASLRERMPEMGQDVAIDASDMPGYGNGQRYLSKNGPERERYSDPDASWATGRRSAQGAEVGFMAIASMLLSAREQGCRSRGKSRQPATMRRPPCPACSTRSSLAAS